MAAIEYRDTAEGLDEAQLGGGFFEGWPSPPSPRTHLRLLTQSDAVVLALDASDRRVVGFVTAISDGVLAAYIPFLEVLGPYRGRGIGSELVRRVLRRLEHLYMIDLVCDADVEPFYERLGMTKRSGMILRNRARQSGDDAPPGARPVP